MNLIACFVFIFNLCYIWNNKLNVQKQIINYYNYSNKVTCTNICIVTQLCTPWSYLAQLTELVVNSDSRVRQ